MGGIFGKNKKLCVFPKRVVFYKAKRKEPAGTLRMFCDASTWTGENHFHSARIGRTPRGPDVSAAKLALAAPGSESAAQAQGETGEQAAPLCAQRTEVPLSVHARGTQEVEMSQDSGAKPSTEVTQHQELAEGTKEAQAARKSSQESRKTEAVLHPAGSCVSNEQLGCEDREVTPLAQSTVTAEVHVSADVQGGPGKVQSASMEPELPTDAEQEAGAPCASEEPCAGKTHQEEPVQNAAASSAALCPTEELELPLKATETREDTTNVQRSAEEQAVEEKVPCTAEAPPDLQLQQGTEVPVTEDKQENALEMEQGKEMVEVCDDGQTSKEPPRCLAETQDKEKIQGSNGGETREALKKHVESGPATTEQTEGLSAAE